ncbi:MAG TPA: hypothetical protein DIS90_08690 [Cytophagales bacterium]|nr:hypothetical protein [Cytophagales bacterium]
MNNKYLYLVAAFLLSTFWVSAQNVSTEQAIKKYKWRAIGPANMGGRVTDIVGVPGDQSTFYFGGADGGVFKTTNGGVTFEALFTDQRAFSVGALALAPSNTDVVWLGSGEGDPRNSVGYGNGVYRSVDGGKSWKHLGLDKTERIKRIVVDPNDPDVACVCALGREWGSNPDRGVFLTKDAGKNWEKVLYLDETTGCSDIAMELSNPKVLYAGMWTFSRKPWRFDDGGGKTAVYRSLDGGKTWEKIMKGLPNKPMARIGLSIAQSQPNTVYMITEFKDLSGTLFRSDDRGSNWKMVNDDPNLNFRPFYYSDVRVDPSNPDHLFTLSGRLSKSTDGGRTFKVIARDVHGDHQSLWINPKNGKHVLSGSDGGYQVSYDGGETWDIINNVELSQFYQILVDDKVPYNVYGGLQDNGTWVGPSNSLVEAGIMKRHWTGLAGGDGYYAVPIPGQEHEIYANLQGGVIFHVDTKLGNVRNIHPYPKITGSAGDAIDQHKYRFNWDSPIHISPHDPNTVYTGGNVIFRSRDKGYNWEEISPDLTTNDKSKQISSGGEIYQDNTAAEFHCTVLTIAESPKQKDVIWAGTDDGNIQITRDGGKTWANVKNNIKGLPAFAWVGKIHASEHDAGTAFVAVDQHRMDDFTPHAYMTTDYGKTWSTISGGLPQDDYVKVVRQDPHNPNLLFAGMEHGIFASWDKGKSWTKINVNLPPVSVRDLRVQARERDLVIGTHGRGAWILDDIRPLEEMGSATSKAAHVFPVRDAILWHYHDQVENLGDRTYRAKNPEFGAYINFYLQKDPTGPVEVSILDNAGKHIQTIKDTLSKAGINRIVWNLRSKGALALDNPPRGGWRSGSYNPMVIPGMYTAKIKVNEQELTTSILVKPDPRAKLSDQDYRMKLETTNKLNDLLSKTNEMINNSESVVKQLKQLKEKLKSDQEIGSDKALNGEIDQAIKKLQNFTDDVLRRPPPNMNYRQRPRLREEIGSLMYAVDGATARPSTQQSNRSVELDREAGEAASQLERILSDDVQKINDKVKNMPQIVVKKPAQKEM